MADTGFTTPTVKTIQERIFGDINTNVEGADSRLRRSTLNGLATALAGAVWLLYAFINFLACQLLVDRAEQRWLLRHASIWRLTKTPGVAATGSVTITGANILVDLTQVFLIRADRVRYSFVPASVTLSGGSATVMVQCATVGLTGNLDASSVLAFETPIAQIEQEATVGSAGLTGGTEQETDEALRTRVINRLQNPPQGGADADYRTWALEVPGVTRVWPHPITPLNGEVEVYFTRDNDASIIPDTSERQTVLDYLNTVRPVTALVTCPALTAEPVGILMSLNPDTAAVRAAVTTEVAAFFLRESEPGGTIRLSRLQEVISVAAGESYHTLTVPSADVTASSDAHILTASVITFS